MSIAVKFFPRRTVEQVEEGTELAPRFDEHGLIPCITTAASGEVLMLGYMNEEALKRTIATGEAHYWSRSRQVLWHKGATSGNTQRVVEVVASGRVPYGEALEWQRALARARLEQTDLQRRRLFGDITHELATPLTSIRGYVETMLDPNVPVSAEERSAYLNDVLAEANRLAQEGRGLEAIRSLTEVNRADRDDPRHPCPAARRRPSCSGMRKNSCRRLSRRNS